jgi:hypothetical protein
MLRNYPRLRRWEQTDDVFQTAALSLFRSLTKVKPKTTREFFGLAVTKFRHTLIDRARHHFGPHGQAAHHLSNQQLDRVIHDKQAGEAIVDTAPHRPETLDS